MLRTWSEMRGTEVRATDGACGHVDDILFDDRTGVVRHLAVALGIWPLRRRVLIDPRRVGERAAGALYVAMTRQEIRSAPQAEAHPPVSRQREIESEEVLARRASNWGGANWGVLGIPPVLCMEEEAARDIGREADSNPSDAPATPVSSEAAAWCDPHLRSAREVIGYEAQALSGCVGLVADLWVDDASWQIAHLSLEVGEPPSLGGRHIAVPATLVSGVSWSAQTILLNVERVPSGSDALLDDHGSAKGGRSRGLGTTWAERASLGRG